MDEENEIMTFTGSCPEECHILKNKGIISSALIIGKENVYRYDKECGDNRDISETSDSTADAAHRLIEELCRRAENDGCNALCGVSVSYSAYPGEGIIIGATAEEVILEKTAKTEKMISNAISAVSAVGALRKRSGDDNGEYSIRINSVRPGNEDELTVILAGLMADAGTEELFDACDNLPYTIKGRFSAVSAFDAVNKMSEQGISADVLDDQGQTLYGTESLK